MGLWALMGDRLTVSRPIPIEIIGACPTIRVLLTPPKVQRFRQIPNAVGRPFMSPGQIYAEVKGWQTAIGSTLGFVALLCGALFNFHLNRRRDTALRKEEARSVAAALYGEIRLLRGEVAKLGNHVAWKRMASDDFSLQFVTDHKLKDPVLYGALASKLVILPPALVISIAQFYADYQVANNALELLVERNRGYGYSVLTLLEPAHRAITLVQPALREIETFVGIQTVNHELDITNIDSVIDVERLQFEAQAD